MGRLAPRRRAARRAAILLALLAGGCVGDGSPRTATYDPDKPRDTCQHTSEGGSARTVCY